MDGEAREISERLALVERSMRRYRAALVVVGFIAAAGLARPSLVGVAKTPEVIRARSFAVVDEDGIMRGVLGAGTDYAGLTLYNKAGKTRAGLVTLDDGASLDLYDEAGNVRAALGNSDLKITASGSTEHRAASSLVLFNEQGHVLWEAP